jgi:hypothetical protein
MNLFLIVEDLRMRMNGLVHEQRVLREQVEQQANLQEKFRVGLLRCVKVMGDYKRFKKEIVQMYREYV